MTSSANVFELYLRNRSHPSKLNGRYRDPPSGRKFTTPEIFGLPVSRAAAPFAALRQLFDGTAPRCTARRGGALPSPPETVPGPGRGPGAHSGRVAVRS
eukprot:230154-Hanusia_phi.AAC.1